jgi:hypothetical protein
MLTHLNTRETVDDILPSQVAEREGVSPRVDLAETFAHVPEVANARAELDELRDIGALPEAIAAAHRRLTEAVAHAATLAARERAGRLKKSAAEREQKLETRRAAENLRRRGPESPAVTLLFAGVRVSVRPQFPADPGVRGQIGGAIGRCYRMLEREFLHPREPEAIAAECRDLLRMAMTVGAATVEVLHP